MTLFFFLLAAIPGVAFAHVKWFSNYDFQQPPLTLSQLNTPYFWGLFLLSLVSLPAIVFLDRKAEKSLTYNRINGFLDRYAANGPIIMRVTMGAVLLMSWQADSIIAPEIPIPSAFWGWLELLFALFLIFKETTIFAGIGMVFLWVFGITQHGFFHMLDYVIYPSVGIYLILAYVKNERLKNLDLPILYSGLGFSLCWVAFEKLIYPYWGLSVLAKAPALAMGLPHDFFLLGCAFVEFTLGYLLIICLMQRPLALVITLVFFITTSFFGKTEVVGHTILHGALLVFIVEGPGYYYQAPIRFHKSPKMRSLFAVINFILLFAVLAFPYQAMSKKVHAESMAKRAAAEHPRFEIPDGVPVPKIQLFAKRDSLGGWNVQVVTENFTFTPENAGLEDVLNQGHAHLFINNVKAARVYGGWFHIKLVKGLNRLKVILTTNSHKDYFKDGKPIEALIQINEDREVTVQHAH